MSLIRFNQNRPLSYLEKFFENDDWFSLRKLNDWYVGDNGKVNIKENENDYTIEVSAPGFTKEELTVNISDGILTVSGEHTNESKDEKENFSRREFSKSSFSRSFRIPEDVDENGYDAKFENGILSLMVMKPKELPKVEKKIEIK